MRNKHPGICYRCNEWCPAGDGHFERSRGGWRVQHAACAISHRLFPSLTATPAVSVNAAAPEAASPASINTPASGAGAAAGIGSEL